MKHFLAAGALWCISLPISACDVCGLFLGIQPHERTTNFGLYYRFRHLEGDLAPFSLLLTKHGDANSVASAGPRHYREYYQVIEARADIWLGQRFSVMAGLPLVNNYQSIDSRAHADLYGVGDPYVLGRYIVVNTHCGPQEVRTVHRLTVGAGVKLPLGQHRLTYQGEMAEHDLQPGTGTWDGLATLEYLVRRNKTGASLACTGRYNGEAVDGYTLGHAFSATAEVFQIVGKEALKWAPSLGAYAEHGLPDRSKGTEVEGTGLTTLFAHVGSRVWWHSWTFSVTYQYALANSGGMLMVPVRQRMIVGIAYNLNSNT
ncbi:MAG: hypothetical protein H6594_07010 [Flavobacteriales bacterium]|nr:hypothetical protein [Flavobacteriales bacterium]